MTQYTNVGIHKDDLRFEIDSHPIKKFVPKDSKNHFDCVEISAIRLYQTTKPSNPILLLDDIFDKLDASRVGQIISLVDHENFGQLFISDTHPERTENVIKEVHQSYKMFPL